MRYIKMKYINNYVGLSPKSWVPNIYINGDDWGDGKHGIVKFPHQRGN